MLQQPPIISQFRLIYIIMYINRFTNQSSFHKEFNSPPMPEKSLQLSVNIETSIFEKSSNDSFFCRHIFLNKKIPPHSE